MDYLSSISSAFLARS